MVKDISRGVLRAGYRLANRLLFGTGLATRGPLRALDIRVRRWMRPPIAQVLGHRMVLDPLDSLRLGVFGIHEPTGTRWIEKHVPDGGVAIDVGANIGYYTLLLARRVGPRGHVYAFEPDPENFALLSRNVELNGYENVTLEQAAVGDTAGSARLYRSETNLGDHRAYDSGDRRPWIEVSAVRLDDYFADYTGCLDYLKMDVQGTEAQVLAGMRELLRRYPGLAVAAEFWPQGLVAAGNDPAAFLESLQGAVSTLDELDELEDRVVPTSAEILLRKYTPDNGRATTVLRRLSPQHAGESATRS